MRQLAGTGRWRDGRDRVGAGWLRHRAQAGDPRPDWSHIDLKLGAVELAADEDGRKPGGSWRVVPLVKPLAKRLREQWIAQGRPTTGKVCPPRQYSPSGMLDLGYIQERVHRECRQQGMEPISLHKSPQYRGDLARHPRVSPKVASKPMGRKTPEYQPGAASITLRRYTHTLPGELERARDLLEAFRAPPRPLCTRRSHVPLQGARGRSCRNPESLHLASRRVIAFVVQSSHRGLSPWRPSAGRSTGGASRDAVGLLTPPLLLRREHGHQAPSDRGFRSGTTSRSDSSRVVVGSFVIWMQKSCREPVSAQNKGRTPASVARRASSPRRRST